MGWCALGAVLFASGCGSPATNESTAAVEDEPPQLLSEYALFAGEAKLQQPAPGVIPYDLNSALFSDYTDKFRFIKLPPGETIAYHESETFDFPVGTVIAKTFAYPVDARDPKLGRRLLETRILKHKADGWDGFAYIWNDEQTDATLELAGDMLDTSWIDSAGDQRTNNYIVPNANQCKGCHKQTEGMFPIGPKARHLNRDFGYADGVENQLAHWARVGALAGAPSPDQAPRLAVWNDPSTGTLDERARAWLEINCAHCHNPSGPALQSGLDLMASQTTPTKYGILKPPVAAGRGSGGFSFDIVPGKPDESILTHRIGSTEPGTMMPELGKRLVHTEGVELMREWIASMKPVDQSAPENQPAPAAQTAAPGAD